MTLPNIDKSLLALPDVRFTFNQIKPSGTHYKKRPVLGLPYTHSSKTDITQAFAAERARIAAIDSRQHDQPAPTFPYPGGIQP